MIYCVEDDSSIRDLMVYALRAAGFSAVGCADGEEFWQAMGNPGASYTGYYAARLGW